MTQSNLADYSDDSIDLPIIDKSVETAGDYEGVIVTGVNVDSYSAGTGWYVHLIPSRDDKYHGRWRQADDLTKWCDEELVKVPESGVPEDVDEEWVLTLLEEMLLEDGHSGCKQCHNCVPVGSLEADGGYVATVCRDCAGVCPDCGNDEWENIPKEDPNGTINHSKKECAECGHVAIASVATG